MKRSEKKLWMFIVLLLYLSDMAQNKQVKFLLLTGMLKNNTTNLNSIFNRLLNKQEEQQILQRNLNELSNFASRYNRRN
jgi:hypothetical protein